MSVDSVLGKTITGPLSSTEVEVWDLERRLEVTYSSEEFAALCPVTRQPDLYSLAISYSAARTFESKGLKHYLWGFRDVGLSCEGLALRISRELSQRIEAEVRVTLRQQVRGGLTLHAAAGE